MVVYHMAVVAGVALTAAGSVKLEKHEEPIEKAERMVKVGMAILTIAWGILVGFAGLSWFGPVARESGHMRAGTVVSSSSPSHLSSWLMHPKSCLHPSVPPSSLLASASSTALLISQPGKGISTRSPALWRFVSS